MADARLQLIFAAKDLASKQVDKLHGSLNRLKGGAGKLGGALVTLTKVGVLGLAAGLVGAIGFLGLATKAAAEEQVGIARLSAALKANVKGFEGNTDAIEKLIEKRGDLGFADDELRDSLTLLVAKYKNVDKAMALQAVAMDIARLKGISVTDSSAMLTKALDGNQKILKQLGITLPKTATEQERLTAIQKVAAGQAEAYGRTAAGAQAAFSIAISNVTEDIGEGLLPMMTAAFTWLRVNGIPAVRNIIGQIKGWVDQNQPLISQVKAFVSGALTALFSTIKEVTTAVVALVKEMWDNGKGPLAIAVRTVGDIFKNNLLPFLRASVQEIKQLIQWVKEAIKVLKDLFDAIGRTLGEMGKMPNATVQDLFDARDPRGHAAGGWVGLRGPELAMVGEKGPEYITPNHQLGGVGGGGHSHDIIMDGRKVAEAVDARQYRQMRRTPARVGA